MSVSSGGYLDGVTEYKSADEARAALEAAAGADHGWDIHDRKLTKTFKFKNFKEAMRFMAAQVSWIDEMNHHPEWFNVYNRLEITMTTHDLPSGLSSYDVEAAVKFDKAFQAFS